MVKKTNTPSSCFPVPACSVIAPVICQSTPQTDGILCDGKWEWKRVGPGGKARERYGPNVCSADVQFEPTGAWTIGVQTDGRTDRKPANATVLFLLHCLANKFSVATALSFSECQAARTLIRLPSVHWSTQLKARRRKLALSIPALRESSAVIFKPVTVVY